MKCSKCEAENREGINFCEECGAKMEIKCPSCSASLPEGKKFCGECGHELGVPTESVPKALTFDEKLDKIQRYLPKGLTEKILAQRDRIEGERKQVTVMFCDMEGFTNLSEKLGPEEAYGIMDQVYEILIHKVHEYEGTVNEMTGDGIMALFGAPIALEDAPQRAIRSAYSIHREMVKFSERIRRDVAGIPSIKMRIGIHTGPVVVGTMGNTLRVEFKAVGDTVNLASRIEGLAQPGTTCVTKEVFRQTKGFFQFEALGEKAVKGKEDPVSAYRVIAPSTRKTRFDVSAYLGLTPFVGRERELELLLDCFERAKGGRGQAVSVIADAGVGKSRLLYEFRKAVANEDVKFLEGKCLSYSRGSAYHLHIDILKASFDIREDDGDAEIRRKARKGIEIIGSDEASTLPYLLELLSVKESDINQIPLSPEARKYRTIEALKELALRGAQVRPLILAYEDLHWADKSSEEVLKTLLDSIPGARVLLIFTYRPEYVHTWGGKSYHNQVNLNRLSNRESLVMVRYLLAVEQIDTALEEFILEKTEGIPLFIEEFVRSLHDLHIVEKEGDTYHIVKDLKDVTIPSTIQDVIMARIDCLPERAKGVLQTAAVIGREFSYDLLKTLMEHPKPELLSHLSVLKDSELLYERGIYPLQTYVFKHGVTREIAYNSLLLMRRKEIHKKVGNAIEMTYPERLEEFYEMLAFHYYIGEEWTKALEYLVRAGDKLTAAYANLEALECYARALEACEKLGDSALVTAVDMARKRGLVNGIIGDSQGAVEDFNKMLAAARNVPDRRLEGMALAYLGRAEFVNSKTKRAEKTLRDALVIAEEGFEDVRFFASANLGGLFLTINRHDEAEPFLHAAEKLAPKADDLVILSFWYMFGTLWLNWQGRFNDALKVQADLHGCFRRGGVAFLMNSWVEALARGGKGDYEQALALLKEVIADSKRIGAIAYQARAFNTMGWLYGELQDHRQAMTWNTQGIEAARKIIAQSLEAESYARMNLGRNLLALDRLEEAKGQFQSVEQAIRGLRLQEEYMLWRYSQSLYHSYGELWLARDEPDKALAYANKCLTLAEQSKSQKNIVRARRLRGQVRIAQSKLAEAGKEISVAVEAAQCVGNPTQLWKTFAVLGDLLDAQGRPDDAQQAYDDALTTIEKVVTSLKNDSLRETFTSSQSVQLIRDKAKREKPMTRNG